MFDKRMVAAALAASLLTCGTAHATSQDDQYLGLLAKRGIQGDPGQLIGDAHNTCDNANYTGLQNFGMGAVRWGIVAQGFTAQQTDNILIAAITVYCPEKMPPGLSPLT